MVKLSPIKGIDTMLLHYDSEKGWLFEFWMGRKFGAAERYVVTKDFTIYGVFTTISMVKQLTAEEYWLDNKKTEEEAIAYVAENINLSYLQTCAKSAVVEFPIVTMFKNAMK